MNIPRSKSCGVQKSSESGRGLAAVQDANAPSRVIATPPGFGVRPVLCRFSSPRPWPPKVPERTPRAKAFTLIEVMIACGIFFIAVFAILALVSQTLRNAQALRHIPVDAGMVAAQFLGKTNRMTLGTDSGDFGNLYPDCFWETDTEEAGTNGLVQVDIVVRRRGQQDPVDKLSILVFDPTLPQNKFGAPRVRQ